MTLFDYIGAILSISWFGIFMLCTAIQIVMDLFFDNDSEDSSDEEKK